jgi:hypothetical protein
MTNSTNNYVILLAIIKEGQTIQWPKKGQHEAYKNKMNSGVPEGYVVS